MLFDSPETVLPMNVTKIALIWADWALMSKYTVTSKVSECDIA